jgi:DnaJ family protein C protein 28
MSPNIEEHIRRAMEEGQFDDLPGKGKPLHLEDHPFEDPDWRMAYHVLRTSGFSLPWIETRREIEEAFLAARQAVQRAWDWRQKALQDPASRHLAAGEWERAVQAFRTQVEDLNRRIFSYNLEAPNERFQLAPLNFERLLQLTTSPASDTI